jgi:class III poly(R)-hydroxyalkanoic acid synthase PhaE subunit
MEEDNHTFSRQQQEQIKNNIFDFWSELVKLPTVGPFQAFSKDFIFYMQEFFNLGQTLCQFQNDLKEYWIQISDAYSRGMKEIAEKTPEKQYDPKADPKNYRNIAIDAFEDAFTGLFGSDEFGVIYGKLLRDQLDLSKHLQNIAEQNFKALNLPTRSEIDEISKDIHELKRTVRNMKKNLEIFDRTG